LEESKQVVGKTEEAHEHEILELTGKWSRKCRKLAREGERLNLAGEASGDLERKMCKEAASSKRKVDHWAEVDSDVEVTSNMSNSTNYRPLAPRHG